jgi:hypothetical protein
MNQSILQVHFNYTMPTAEFEGLCEHAAPAIADVSGLRWKIFLLGFRMIPNGIVRDSVHVKCMRPGSLHGDRSRA